MDKIIIDGGMFFHILKYYPMVRVNIEIKNKSFTLKYYRMGHLYAKVHDSVKLLFNVKKLYFQKENLFDGNSRVFDGILQTILLRQIPRSLV